jgi:hypothetical protein
MSALLYKRLTFSRMKHSQAIGSSLRRGLWISIS